MNTLDHTQNPETVLKEIQRVLAEDGTLLMTLDTFTLPSFLRATLLQTLDPMHPHHFNDKITKSMLDNAKLHIVWFVHKESGISSTFDETRMYIKRRQLDSALKVLVAKLFFGLEVGYVRCVKETKS